MRDSITVDGTEYEVERHTNQRTGAEDLTLPDFPGIEGTLDYEREDHECHNPREWDNVGTMSVSYRGYRLGDEDISEINFTEVECPTCEDNEYCQIPHPEREGEMIDCPACDATGYVQMNPAEYFIRKHGARVVIGLFVYEHSGITMSAGPRVGEVLRKSDIRSTGRFIGDDAGWDTSFVGFIYDTPENVEKCLGKNVSDEVIENALRSEVKVYASYLEGDVTWWSVNDDEYNFSEGCGGFIGDSDECEQECFIALAQAVENRINEDALRAYWAERDVNTI